MKKFEVYIHTPDQRFFPTTNPKYIIDAETKEEAESKAKEALLLAITHNVEEEDRHLFRDAIATTAIEIKEE